MNEPSRKKCIQNLIEEGKLCRHCFEQFLRIAANSIRRRYYRELTEAEIEDTAKDATLTMWKSRAQCHGSDTFPGWFAIIVRRAAQARLRHEPLERRPISLDTELQSQDGSDEKIEIPVDDEALQDRVFHLGLETAFQDEKLLTERQRMIVRYRLQGKTFNEIGNLMGCTANAALLVMADAAKKIGLYLGIEGKRKRGSE